MGVNGIGNYGISNRYYNYQANVNQLRLQQALQSHSSNKVEPVTKVPDPVVSDSVDFLKSYNKDMTDLLSSANALKNSTSSGVMNQLTANSSDKDTVTAKANYTLKQAETYDISVEQLAAAQKNVSTAVNGSELAGSDMNLSIITSSANETISVSKLNADGSQKTNTQQLKDMAQAINQKDLGVSASVVTKDGKSTLEIASLKTGESSTFLVSGESAQSSGLDQAVQKAQDARYTVRKDDGVAQAYTAASNNINLDYGKISATLKKTGDASINVDVDDKKVVAAVDALVKDYNKALKTLNDNAYRGTGVTGQLRNMLISPTSTRSMEMIGITTNKDGTLSVDSEKLTTSLKDDPELTKEILGGSNSLAAGTFQDAQSGLSRTSFSLVNNDFKKYEQDSINDPTNFMNLYARNGSRNLMNYYATGMLFSMTV